jgi:nucleoside-diphosphate-sugar epimerase
LAARVSLGETTDRLVVRILITGNMGYVGPVAARRLRRTRPDAEIVGYDAGFFAHCLTGEEFPERLLNAQRFGDVRDMQAADVAGFDAIVHLAAISNDPMGKRYEAVTDAINHRASLRLAQIAAANGVKSFVFASSCSVYGFAQDGRARRESDALNPLTAYARSKIDTENGLSQLPDSAMNVTCLRFATACGMSPRLRLDLVVNDFVACAKADGAISVLSDGTPWRPLIDVRDMARAIDWAIDRQEQSGGRFVAINAGSDQWNYQVRDLAEAVAHATSGTRVSINTEAPPDQRSYRVDFSLFRELAPQAQPRLSLNESIAALRDGLEAMHFADANFRNSHLIRLKMLEAHASAGRLNDDMRWRN